MKTERKSVSSAHKLDGLGKLKEHAPRSEHVHLHQDIGHIRKNHLHATHAAASTFKVFARKRNLLNALIASHNKFDSKCDSKLLAEFDSKFTSLHNEFSSSNVRMQACETQGTALFFFFGWCYSYGPQQGPDRQHKKEERGLKQRRKQKEAAQGDPEPKKGNQEKEKKIQF